LGAAQNLLDLASFEGEHLLLLTEEERVQLDSLYRKMSFDAYDQFEGFLLEANLFFHEFPSRIRREILKFRRVGTSDGIILVRGLPVDDPLPPTPLDSRRSFAKRTQASEFWLSSFSTALGEPVAYMQEKDGAIFHEVSPTRENEELFSSESSKAFLPFHVEIAFHPFMPSYVSLYCLRQDSEQLARTLTASIRRIYPYLTSGQIEILKQPVYETGVDYSFGSPNAKRGGGLITPILYGDHDDPYFRFDPDLMKAHTREGEEMVRTLTGIVNRVATGVRLQAGDLLIVDNRRAVHARTEFVAHYDGTDRWLQRMLLVDSLAESSADRRHMDRVIRTEFPV
jgi:hypothetical protein